MSIDDAIMEIRSEEEQARRHALLMKQPMHKIYYIKRANNLAQLASWLTDYKRMAGIK